MGAGLVGSLLSIYLAKRGHTVNLYERRSDMRKQEMSAGRSINLALSDRGWRALEGVGIDKKVREVAIPMPGRMLHQEDGSTGFQPYGIGDQAIYSVSRGGLNALLMDEAEKAGVTIHFNQGVEEVDLDNYEVLLSDGTTLNPDLTFGADGAFSRVRLSMMKTDRFDYSQYYLPHGYKELSIPPAEGGGWRIEKNALHIWPRHSFMLIALPNLDGSFTCTLFAPFDGPNGFNQLTSNEAVVTYFEKHFPSALEHMPTLVEDINENPTSSLVTVRCYPWSQGGRVALIGDASHAIVPFYGQGMNCGFEDCTILDQFMSEHGDDWKSVFSAYEQSRKPSGDAIADLAFRNFVEMRDKVADDAFLYRKQIERILHERYPEEFIPLYSQVTFSHIPYEKALAAGEDQDAFFAGIMDHVDLTTPPSEAEVKWVWEQWQQHSAS